MSAPGVSIDLEKVEAECQSSRYEVSWDWLDITGDSRMG